MASVPLSVLTLLRKVTGSVSSAKIHTASSPTRSAAARFACLAGEEPPHAIREAFVDMLARRYQGDLAFELERARFIYATQALHGAAVEAQLADRDELTVVLRCLLSPEQRHVTPLLAGAAVLALDVAVERWQEVCGEKDLGALVRQVFTTLEDLGSVR